VMGKGGMGKPVDNPDPEEDKKIIPLDEDDIALLKTYGLGPYSASIKALETDLKAGLARASPRHHCTARRNAAQLMPPSVVRETACVVRETNLTPGSEGNPRRARGQNTS
jgi:hypothetical protein